MHFKCELQIDLTRLNDEGNRKMFKREKKMGASRSGEEGEKEVDRISENEENIHLIHFKSFAQFFGTIF